MSEQPQRPSSNWTAIAGPSSIYPDGRITKRLPPDPIHVDVRPGMVVGLYHDLAQETTAIVVDITPDFCIVQTESGRAYALSWLDVDVTCARPDPAALAQRQKGAE